MKVWENESHLRAEGRFIEAIENFFSLELFKQPREMEFDCIMRYPGGDAFGMCEVKCRYHRAGLFNTVILAERKFLKARAVWEVMKEGLPPRPFRFYYFVRFIDWDCGIMLSSIDDYRRKLFLAQNHKDYPEYIREIPFKDFKVFGTRRVPSIAELPPEQTRQKALLEPESDNQSGPHRHL